MFLLAVILMNVKLPNFVHSAEYRDAECCLSVIPINAIRIIVFLLAVILMNVKLLNFASESFCSVSFH